MWFQIKAADSGDHADILIYSEIGESFWTETVDAKSFVTDLQELDVATIAVRINSPGGSVFDGVAIYNALKRHPAAVTTHVDGVAASIASIVALAGDRVVMAKNATMMIHNPWSMAMGDAAELRKTADLLDKLRGTLLSTYADKSGQPDDVIAEAMDAETWYDADEAVAFGLADVIENYEAPIAQLAQFSPKALDRFRHTPDRIAAALRERPKQATDTKGSVTNQGNPGSAGSVSDDDENPAPKPIDPTVVAGLMAFPY